MNSNIALTALASCILPFAAHATQIVNISALSSNGTAVTLNAGTYEISVIGTSQGGAYNAWESLSHYGVTWSDAFGITANGVTTSYFPTGDPTSSTAAKSLSLYESNILDANGTKAAGSTPDEVIFTVNSKETVDFTIPGVTGIRPSMCQSSDFSGGTSLEIHSVDPSSATPEPSTFALIGLGLAGSIAAFRRKWAANVQTGTDLQNGR